MASLADLEARVAALEADRADYRAVLAAVGALGQRVDRRGSQIDALTTSVAGIDQRLSDVAVTTNANREAINALGEKLAADQADTREQFSALRNALVDHRQETRAGFRAVDDQLADIKDLIVDGLGGRDQ